MSDDTAKICHRCLMCQRTKQQYTKYGQLLEKQANKQPWEIMRMDLIGLCHIPWGKGSNQTTIVLYCVTMIDPATGWFKMKETNSHSSSIIANTVKQTRPTSTYGPRRSY
eukprot:11944338-Ditylum_brightwellii.AAC.1